MVTRIAEAHKKSGVNSPLENNPASEYQNTNSVNH